MLPDFTINHLDLGSYTRAWQASLRHPVTPIRAHHGELSTCVTSDLYKMRVKIFALTLGLIVAASSAALAGQDDHKRDHPVPVLVRKHPKLFKHFVPPPHRNKHHKKHKIWVPPHWDRRHHLLKGYWVWR
jgi:hypothetical protein